MVSNHIQALEERLGARLLNRTTRKVSVTEIGKAYYDRCTQILADIEQADDIAGALAIGAAGHAADSFRHPHGAFRCRHGGEAAVGVSGAKGRPAYG